MIWFDWILAAFLMVQCGWNIGRFMDESRTPWRAIVFIVYGLLGSGVLIWGIGIQG